MNARRASTRLVLALLALAWASSADLRAQEPSSPSPAFVKALEKGEALMEQGKYEQAIKPLKKAEKLSAEPSASVFLNLAICSHWLSELGNAEDYARAALKVAVEPAVRAGAYNLLGLSLVESAESGIEELREAEVAFRTVLELTQGEANIVRFSLANVLERLHRDAEALIMIDEFLSRDPDRFYRESAWSLRTRIRRRFDPTSEAKLERFLDLDPAFVFGELYRREDDELMRRAAHMYLDSQPEGEYAMGARWLLRRIDGELALGAEAEAPIHVAGDMIPPIKLAALQPQYTEVARKARIQGVVIVQAIIDRDGTVTSVKLLKDLPWGLGEVALETIKDWKFIPAMLADGRPVSVYYTLTVNFQLQ